MASKPDIAAKVVDFAAEKAAESEFLANKLAVAAYAGRTETANNVFNWLSEDTQRDLTRSDSRWGISLFLEKWCPQLDYRSLNIPKEFARNFVSFLVTWGVVDAKQEIIDDMRGNPGAGIYKMPDAIITVLFTAMGVPELIPLFKIAKSVSKVQEGLPPMVRERVKEKVKSAEVSKVQKVEHDAEVGAAGIEEREAA